MQRAQAAQRRGVVVSVLAAFAATQLPAPALALPEPALFVLATAGLDPAVLDELVASGRTRVDARAAGFLVIHGATMPPAQRLTPENNLATSSTSDPLADLQWSLASLRMSEVWAIIEGSAGPIVAVVDSGVARDHPDLNRVVLDGVDLVDRDLDPADENGHGSHVAGVIAAVRGNAEGIAGLAPYQILPIRVLDASGAGTCVDVALAVLAAVERDAGVINLSLRCNGDNLALRLAIAAAQAAGVVVVAAAGNDGPARCIDYPAAYDGVIAVGATTPDGVVAEFSCRSARLDLVAPGTQIISTLPDDAYGNLTGTSIASAHVAAAAAMLKAREPSLSPQAVAQRLFATAIDIGPPGRDDAAGHGELSIIAALKAR